MELSGVEDHKKAVQGDIARRAYALYEFDDFKDGLDVDHWFLAVRGQLSFDPFALFSQLGRPSRNAPDPCADTEASCGRIGSWASTLLMNPRMAFANLSGASIAA
jgi:DUF2934 family protein